MYARVHDENERPLRAPLLGEREYRRGGSSRKERERGMALLPVKRSASEAAVVLCVSVYAAARVERSCERLCLVSIAIAAVVCEKWSETRWRSERTQREERRSGERERRNSLCVIPKRGCSSGLALGVVSLPWLFSSPRVSMMIGTTRDAALTSSLAMSAALLAFVCCARPVARAVASRSREAHRDGTDHDDDARDDGVIVIDMRVFWRAFAAAVAAAAGIVAVLMSDLRVDGNGMTAMTAMVAMVNSLVEPILAMLMVMGILKSAPGTATLGEACILAGATVGCNGLLVRRWMGDAAAPIALSTSEADVIVMFGVAGASIATVAATTCFAALYSFKYRRRHRRTESRAMNAGNGCYDSSSHRWIPAAAYTTLGALVVTGIALSGPLWRAAVPEAQKRAHHPVAWMLSFVFGTRANIYIIGYWVALLMMLLPAFLSIARANRVSGSGATAVANDAAYAVAVRQILIRKLYHILSLVLFVPCFILSPDLMKVAFVLALIVMIVLELVRANTKTKASMSTTRTTDTIASSLRGKHAARDGASQVASTANRGCQVASKNERKANGNGNGSLAFVNGDDEGVSVHDSTFFSLHLFDDAFGRNLHRFFMSFTDDRDEGTVIVSHFSLLVGVAAPLWVSPSSVSVPCMRGADDAAILLLMRYSGLLVLGVMDTVGSFVGCRTSAAHKINLNIDNKKTVQGTLAGMGVTILVTLALLCVVLAQQPDTAPGSAACDMIELLFHCRACIVPVVVACVAASLVEAFTDQLDNIFLPIVFIAML